MLTVNRRQFVFAGIILAGTLFGIYFDPFFSDDNVSLRASWTGKIRQSYALPDFA